MLNSLKIQNFKAIENLEIPELGQINLITGKNNTCKTSVLEAVSILVSGFDKSWLTKLISNRGETPSGKDKINGVDYCSTFFTGRKIVFDQNHKVYIGNENKFISFATIYSDLSGKIVDSSSSTARKSLLLTIDNKDFVKDLSFGAQFPDFGKQSEEGTFYFVDARSVEIERSTEKLWNKISLTEKEDIVIDVIKIIEPLTEKIAFSGHTVKIKLKGAKTPMFLLSMGDGVNRILNIALAMVNAENGYLFIDEVENGLHYSVQVQLWETIFFLAKKLNIQVFATTHSSDAVAAFSIIATEKGNEKLGKVVRLSKKNDELKSSVFADEELKIAYENDMNLR